MARDALRTYFRSVVSGLLERGVVRQRAGQSLDDILKSESARVLQEVKEDFFVVGAELGLGFMSSAGAVLGGLAQRGIDQATQTLVSSLVDAFSGKKH